MLFSFERSSEGVHGTSMVLLSASELLLFLSDAPINLLAHLGQLQGRPQHLVLLLLQGTLGLLQGQLQLLLLLLQVAPLLVQIMDGAPTLTKLVKQILDLISKVFVLALDNIKMLNSFLLCGLQPEELG